MTEKTRVRVIVGSGIAYKATDPRHVFYDVKTADYPWKIFASRGMFIGGQWIKETARFDRNPRDTFEREVGEELSFDKPRISTDEMRVMCPLVEYDTYIAPGGDFVPGEDDQRALAVVKQEIVQNAEAFGDYTILVPESLIQTLQPEYHGGDLTALFSIFTAGLSDETWTSLCDLQRKARNLSNESQSIVTSAGEIVQSGVHLGSGYDQILRDFFLAQAVPQAIGLPIEHRIEVVRVGTLLPTYADYLLRYDVENTPPVVVID